jgi:hypothetical protein
MKNSETSPKSKSTSTGNAILEELQVLVNNHRVCWEVLPEQIPVKEDKPLSVGFNLMLYGTHLKEDHPVPGCDKCKLIHKDLHQIALWIIPEEKRSSRYEISIYQSTIGYSRERGNRPDVELRIKILHRFNFNQPIDECEVQCLNEMKKRLSVLGAHERQWNN